MFGLALAVACSMSAETKARRSAAKQRLVDSRPSSYSLEHPGETVPLEVEFPEEGKLLTMFCNALRKQTTGRNEPCQCGSGVKFKKCCDLVIQMGKLNLF